MLFSINISLFYFSFFSWHNKKLNNDQLTHNSANCNSCSDYIINFSKIIKCSCLIVKTKISVVCYSFEMTLTEFVLI